MSERVTAQITFRVLSGIPTTDTSVRTRRALARLPHYTDNLIIVSLTAAVTLLPIMIAGDGRQGRRRRFLPLALSTTEPHRAGTQARERLAM